MASPATATQLREQMLAIQQQLQELQNQIPDIYGRELTAIIGQETLFNIPEVRGADLGLAQENRHPEGKVTPDLFKGAVVRGLTQDNRPFVAIKVELLDPKTMAVVDRVVELVIKYSSLDGDGKKGGGCENNYITALSNRGQKGNYDSVLYKVGGMHPDQMRAAKDLLDGKTLDPIHNQFLRGKHLVRMVKE